MSDYSDRYAPRVDYSYLEAPQFLGKTAVSGSDSLGMNHIPTPQPIPRRTTAQLQILWDHLSDRDQQLLVTLRRFRLATTDQLQRQLLVDHASTDSARRITRRILKRLTAHGLTRPLGRRIGGIKSGSTGMVWTLTPHGHRLLGETTRKRSTEPSLAHVRHVLAITELATDLTEHARTRSLELAIETEPACWRSPDDLILKPDLFVQVSNHDTDLLWFVEVDLDTESGPVITKKLKRYDRYWRTGTEQTTTGVFPKVLWIAPYADRARFIADRTVHQTINNELFTTTTAENAVATLTDFTDPKANP